jgi:hypothetical protein
VVVVSLDVVVVDGVVVVDRDDPVVRFLNHFRILSRVLSDRPRE